MSFDYNLHQQCYTRTVPVSSRSTDSTCSTGSTQTTGTTGSTSTTSTSAGGSIHTSSTDTGKTIANEKIINAPIDEVINKFTSGNMTIVELNAYFNSIGIKATMLATEKKVSFTFKYKGKEFFICCTKDAAKSSKDEITVTKYTTEYLKETLKFDNETIKEYFDVVRSEGGQVREYTLKSGIKMETVEKNGVKSQYIYDENGKKVFQNEVNSEGKFATYDYSYDSTGNVSFITKNCYDKDGKLEKEVIDSYKDNKIVSGAVHYYDKAGNITTEEKYSYINGKVSGLTVTSYNVSTKNAVKVSEYGYDKNGKQILKLQTKYDKDGTKTSTVENKYNDEGVRTRSITSSYENGKKVSSKSEYFDENGNITQEEDYLYNDGKDCGMIYKRFDVNTNKVVETIVYSGDSEHRTKQSMYQYKSDGTVLYRVYDQGKWYNCATLKEDEFNSDNVVVKTETTEKNGVKSEIAYDNNGNKVFEKRFDSNGVLTKILHCVYSIEGKLVRTDDVDFDKDGNPVDKAPAKSDTTQTAVNDKKSDTTPKTTQETKSDTTPKTQDIKSDTTPATTTETKTKTLNLVYEEPAPGTSKKIVVSTKINGKWQTQTLEYNQENIAKYQTCAENVIVEIITTVKKDDGTVVKYTYNPERGSVTTLIDDDYSKSGQGRLSKINKGKISKSIATLRTKDIVDVISAASRSSNLFGGFSNLEIMRMQDGFGTVSENFLLMSNNYGTDTFAKRLGYAKRIGCDKMIDNYKDTKYAEYLEKTLRDALTDYGYDPSMVKGYHFPTNSTLSKTISDGSKIDPDIKNLVKNNIQAIKNGNFPIGGAFNNNKDLYYSIHGFNAIDGKISGTTLTLTLCDIYDFDASYIDKLENTPESEVGKSLMFNAAGAAAMQDGRIVPYYTLIEVKIDLTQIFSAAELKQLGIC